MSKKQRKQFVATVVVLLACVAAYFAIDMYSVQQKNAQEEESEKKANANITVAFEMESVDNVTGFAYVVDGETVMLLKDNEGNWLNSADESLNIDESAVESTMLSNLIYVESTEVIENPEDISIYGFDNPTNQIVVSMEDGKTHTITIGAQNDFDTGLYYMMLEGDENVYVIDSVIPNAFSMTAEELIEEETTVSETSLEETSVVNE